MENKAMTYIFRSKYLHHLIKNTAFRVIAATSTTQTFDSRNVRIFADHNLILKREDSSQENSSRVLYRPCNFERIVE